MAENLRFCPTPFVIPEEPRERLAPGPTKRQAALFRRRDDLRLAKDFEAAAETAETWLYVAHVKLLTRRIARA